MQVIFLHTISYYEKQFLFIIYEYTFIFLWLLTVQMKNNIPNNILYKKFLGTIYIYLSFSLVTGQVYFIQLEHSFKFLFLKYDLQ